MTSSEVATTGPTGLANPEDFEGSTGLEDIDRSDIAIPRLRILHKEGLFENAQTKQQFEVLDAIVLGLVKQRIMWDATVEDDDVPQCKSPDFTHGFPNTRDDIEKRLRFPWGKSNFDKDDLRVLATPEYNSNGHGVLPCGNCVFQLWDKGDWKRPPCNEQHTYPLLVVQGKGTDDEDYYPALLTVQRSSIKNSRNYVGGFKARNTPMYTVYTQITLEQQSKGTNKYSVPVFKQGEGTPREDWRQFAVQMRSIREFVRQPPRALQSEDDDESTMEASSSEESTPAPSSPKSPTATPKSKVPSPAEPETSGEDDDLPF
jgi:hypothetical protein